MHQSSNSKTYQHEYKGEDLPFCYSSKPMKLYLQSDSNDTIYKVRFETQSTHLKPALEMLSKHITNRKLDDLQVSLANDFEHSSFEEDFSLLHFQNALSLFKGNLQRGLILDENELICRCTSLDKTSLEVCFLKNEGTQSSILKETNASKICGSCANELKKNIHILSVKHKLYEGQGQAYWNHKIGSTLEKFYSMLPAEFDGATFSPTHINMPYLKFEINIPHDNLTLDMAKDHLDKFIKHELAVEVILELTINRTFSN